MRCATVALAVRPKQHLLASVVRTRAVGIYLAAPEDAFCAEQARGVLEECRESRRGAPDGVRLHEPHQVFRRCVLPAQSHDAQQHPHTPHEEPAVPDSPEHSSLGQEERARFDLSLHLLGEGPDNDREYILETHEVNHDPHSRQAPPQVHEFREGVRRVAGLLPLQARPQTRADRLVVRHQATGHGGQVDHLSGPARSCDPVHVLVQSGRHGPEDHHPFRLAEEVIHLLGKIKDVKHGLVLAHRAPHGDVHSVERVPRGTHGGCRVWVYDSPQLFGSPWGLVAMVWAAPAQTPVSTHRRGSGPQGERTPRSGMFQQCFPDQRYHGVSRVAPDWHCPA